jgi:nucleoid DNA-binding protein
MGVLKKNDSPKDSKTSLSTATKKNLIHSISQEKGIHPSDVRHVIQAFLDKMTDRLKEGDRLEFRDFGVFEVVARKQKIGRNPKRAEEPIVIPARYAVKFTPGKKMRKLVDKAMRHEPAK